MVFLFLYRFTSLSTDEAIFAAKIGNKDTVDKLMLLYWKMHKMAKNMAMLKVDSSFDSIQLGYGKVPLENYFQFNSNHTLNMTAKHRNIEEAIKQLLGSLCVCSFSDCADTIVLSEKMASTPSRLLEILDLISGDNAFKCYPNLTLPMSGKGRPESHMSDRFKSWFTIHEFHNIGAIMAAFIEHSIMISFESTGDGNHDLVFKDLKYFRLKEEIPAMIVKYPEMIPELKVIVKQTLKTEKQWLDECNNYSTLPPSKLKYLSREQRLLSMIYQNHYNPEFNGFCQYENLYAQLCTTIDAQDKGPLLLMVLNPQFQHFGNIINFVFHTSLNDWSLALNNLKIENLNKSLDSDSSAEKKKKKKKKKNKKKKKDEKLEVAPQQLLPTSMLEERIVKEEVAQVSPSKSTQNLKAGESTADINTNCVTWTNEEQKTGSKPENNTSGSMGLPILTPEPETQQARVTDSVPDGSLKAKDSKKEKTRIKTKFIKENTNAVMAKEDEVYSISLISLGNQDRNYCNSVGESEFTRDQIQKPIRIPSQQEKHLRKQSFGNEDSAFKNSDYDKEKASKTERFLSTDLKMKTKNFNIVELNNEPKIKPEKKLSADFKNPHDPLGLLQQPSLPVAVCSAKAGTPKSDEEANAVTPTNHKSAPVVSVDKVIKAPPTPVFGVQPPPHIPEMPPLSYSISTPAPDFDVSPKLEKKKPTLKKVVPGAKKHDKGATRLKLKKNDRYEDDKGKSGGMGESDYKRKLPVPSYTASSNTGGWISAGAKNEKEKTVGSLSSYSGYTKKTDERSVNQPKDLEPSSKNSPIKEKSVKSISLKPEEPIQGKSLLDKFNSKLESQSSKSGISDKKSFTPTIDKSPLYSDKLREVHKYLNEEAKRLVWDTKEYAKNTEMRRKVAKDRIKLLMNESFNSTDIDLKTYGSSETRLIIPYSDIDLMISIPGESPQKSVVITVLELLKSNLEGCNWASKIEFFKDASVPILKIDVDTAQKIIPTMFDSRHLSEDVLKRLNILASDDKSSQPNIQKVDLIVETKDISAMKTTEYQRKAIEEYPDMFSLAMLFKYYLTLQNLNKPYLGKIFLFRRFERLPKQPDGRCLDGVMQKRGKKVRGQPLSQLQGHAGVLWQDFQPSDKHYIDQQSSVVAIYS
jgi:hypothetical protein